MEGVITMAKEEGLFEITPSLEGELQKALEALSLTKEEFFKVNKGQIALLLEDEIASKYYYRRGAVQSSLRYDNQLLEAVRQWSTNNPLENLK